MADMAALLNKTSDVQKWTKLGISLRKVFQERFYNSAAQVYGHGDELELQSLTAAPLALDEYAPVVPPADRPAVLANLKQDIVETQKARSRSSHVVLPPNQQECRCKQLQESICSEHNKRNT